jgi:hypothetical protein
MSCGPETDNVSRGEAEAQSISILLYNKYQRKNEKETRKRHNFCP